jgi:hypothetical protein
MLQSQHYPHHIFVIIRLLKAVFPPQRKHSHVTLQYLHPEALQTCLFGNSEKESSCARHCIEDIPYFFKESAPTFFTFLTQQEVFFAPAQSSLLRILDVALPEKLA